MLGTRLVSALLLAVPFLAAIRFGFPWFDLVVLVALGILAREWAGLVGARPRADGIAVGAGPVAAAALGTLGLWGWTAAALGVGVAMAGLAGRARGGTAWLAAGVAYLGIPGLALIWLRQVPEDGHLVVFWLILVVWATDTGGYAAGRAIGGPRLAPAVSPRKTWSGLGGAAAAAALVGLAVTPLLRMLPSGGTDSMLPDDGGALMTGALLAVVSQAGDLLESGVKRHFGVKDAGNLIPGHGGLLDRVDGLLFAAPVTVLLLVLLW